jgi:hypothetical protein
VQTEIDQHVDIQHPGRPEQQIEQGEQQSIAPLHGGVGRRREKTLASRHGHPVNRECEPGPDHRLVGAGPQTRREADERDQEEERERSGDAVFGVDAKKLVVERRPDAPG